MHPLALSALFLLVMDHTRKPGCNPKPPYRIPLGNKTVGPCHEHILLLKKMSSQFGAKPEMCVKSLSLPWEFPPGMAGGNGAGCPWKPGTTTIQGQVKNEEAMGGTELEWSQKREENPRPRGRQF
ncbi:hypothetical protein P7K49_034040 [Saguinus oedipus]|uniref:Uncharacterized protein n=1 Tax=Saguinus oedipus TaxID=9490 RepID=A0ABQ9TUP6_SAGOE|nr:hypothetical protein P7K49_034040 [Saguinus oedipus]